MKDIISVSTLCVEKLTLEDNLPHEKAFELIAGMGAKGVDLFEEVIDIHPHPNLYKLRQLQKTIHALGMTINSCWFYTDPLRAIYASSREEVIEQLQEYIAITGFLGGKYIALPPGEPAWGMGAKEAQEALISVYGEIVPVCEEYDVVIGMEVGRMHSPISSPGGALEIVKRMGTRYITVCPDWEAWRLPSDTIPDFYAECPSLRRDPPCPVSVFEEVLPYAPFIHAKLFQYDEKTRLDPNFPLKEMFALINKSPVKHSISMEYEGWTPDCFPDSDTVEISSRLFRMLEENIL